ncbi:MAG: tetratricopeptide repeat protein [Candidatus Methylomirabilales bacterium]
MSAVEPPEAVPPIRATLRGEPVDKLRAEPSRTAPIPEERVAPRGEPGRTAPVQVGPPDSRPSRVGEKPDPTPPVEVDALSSGTQEAAPPRTLRPVVDGKDRYHFNMGLFYQKQGQYAQAFAAYQKTIELNPFHVEAYNNLGVLYKEVGEVDKAIQHYRKALSIDPNYVKAHNNLGVTLIREGKLTEATAQFEHALELNPKNLESYTNLGVIYRRLSRMPEAIRAFEAALSIDPEHAESHYNLAILLEGQGRIAEAVAHYRRFVASAEPRHRSVVARVIAHIQLLGQGTAGPAATRKPLAE